MLSDCYIFLKQTDPVKNNCIISQFPQDYTETIFTKIISNCKAYTQVCTHRDKDLIYYTYVIKIIDGYLGFGFVLNHVMLSEITPIFDAFDNLIKKWEKSDILHVKDKALALSVFYGDLLNEHRIKDIEDCLVSIEKFHTELPQKSYSRGLEEHRFKISHDNETIIESIHQDNFVFIENDFMQKWIVNTITENERKENIRLAEAIRERERIRKNLEREYEQEREFLKREEERLRREIQEQKEKIEREKERIEREKEREEERLRKEIQEQMERIEREKKRKEGRVALLFVSFLFLLLMLIGC